jgi:hypothetical protein
LPPGEERRRHLQGARDVFERLGALADLERAGEELEGTAAG